MQLRLIALCGLIATIAHAQHPAVDSPEINPGDKCELALTFNEGIDGTDFKDWSVNTATATKTSIEPYIRATSTTSGHVYLNGPNQRVEVPDSAAFDFAGAFTISAWAKPNAVDANGRIVYRYDTTSKDGYHISQEIAGSGVWKFTVYVGGASSSIVGDASPTGGWQHVVAVRDASNAMLIYIDGTLQADSASQSGAIDSNSKLFIGIDAFLNTGFAGHIDEVMLFDRALSSDEINTLSQTGKPTHP